MHCEKSTKKIRKMTPLDISDSVSLEGRVPVFIYQGLDHDGQVDSISLYSSLRIPLEKTDRSSFAFPSNKADFAEDLEYSLLVELSPALDKVRGVYGGRDPSVVSQLQEAE